MKVRNFRSIGALLFLLTVIILSNSVAWSATKNNYTPLSGHYNVWKPVSGNYGWQNGSRAKCGQDDISGSNDRLYRGCLFLDLSEIPSNATIKSAKIKTLQLRAQDGKIVWPFLGGIAELNLCYFPNAL